MRKLVLFHELSIAINLPLANHFYLFFRFIFLTFLFWVNQCKDLLEPSDSKLWKFYNTI
jgi:hypothetical protein